METFLPDALTTMLFKTNKLTLTGSVIAVIVVLSVIYLFNGRVNREPSRPSPDHLSPQDLARLKNQSAQGDCAAARSLARYYFDVASSLKSGIEWQRVAAAHCPDTETQVDLARVLMHYKTDSSSDAEIADLIERIRATDPVRASELDRELKK